MFDTTDADLEWLESDAAKLNTATAPIVHHLIADYRAKCQDATLLAETLKGALEEVEGLQRSVNSYAKAVAGMPSAFD